MRHRLLRHQEWPVRHGMGPYFTEERPPIGDIFHPLSRVQLERRSDTMGRPIMTGPTSSFYLAAFVKKFTYSGPICPPPFSTNDLTDTFTRKPMGVDPDNYWGPAAGDETPSTVAHGGEQRKQNVDGRGLVFRRRRAVSAAMPARLEPDRLDPQLPIEEELYG